MIDQLFARENYDVAKKLLDAAAMRHEALATNIANVETPGFKRIDLAPDFQKQLANFSDRPDAANLENIAPRLAEDRVAQSVRSDGNNIEIDRELAEMSRNALEYEFLTQYASDSMRRLKSAITGRVQ